MSSDQELVPTESPSTEVLDAPFARPDSFRNAMYMARTLAKSSFVPKQYQGDEGLGNMLIALELANRSGAPLMAVLQNLHVIHGKPGWSAAWIIMQINSSNRFASELRFEWEGEPVLHAKHGKQIAPGDVCYAWARRHDDTHAIGARISLAMAKDEGWVSRSGSKWTTMPEQMLQYRAATFFARVHCPDVLFGVPTTDEIADVDGGPEKRGGAARLNERAEAHQHDADA